MTGELLNSDGLQLPEAEGVVPRYRIEILDRIGRNWDEIIANFADMCLEQMAAYTVPRWGASRLCGLVLRDVVTNEPMAAAVVVIATLPLIKLGLAYVKFGPLWRRRHAPVNPAILAAALAAIKEVFATERRLVVRVMPRAEPEYEAQWQSALATAGFSHIGSAPDPYRYLVDLRLPEPAQMASLGSKWRANLNKTLASRLDIREVDLKEGLSDFLALYQSMVARKQFTDRHNAEALPAFVDAAAAMPALGVRLFLAYHEGKPIAGSMLVGSGDQVFVAFSASGEQALTLRAGYALRWWIINRLRGSEAHWLDLGGTEGDAGLKSFKIGNVGKRGRVVEIPGEYDFAENALSSIVSAMMTSTRNLMQGRPVQSLLKLGRG
jgi:lipid II:glycine glycyltransferase (peptidoglycan interpeptide bridge formation enzyme)